MSFSLATRLPGLGTAGRSLLPAAGCAAAFAAVVLFSSWRLGAVLLISLPGAAILLARPRWCWNVAMAWTLLLAATLPPPVASAGFWALLGLFLLAAWREIALTRQPAAVFPRGFWITAALWIAWAGVCAATAMDPARSLKEIGRYLFSFAALFTYLHWIRTDAQSRTLWAWLERLALLAAGGLVVQETLNRFAGMDVTVFGPDGAARGSLAELGVQMAAICPMIVSLLAASPRWRTWPRVMTLAVLAGALVCSTSRAACAAAVIGAGAALWLTGSVRARRLTAVAAILLVVVLGGRMAGRFGEGSPAAIFEVLSGRDRLWAAAAVAIGQHPWVGVGPGNWSVWFSRKYVSADFLFLDRQGNPFMLSPGLLGGEAHHLWLTKGAEMGIASMLLLTAMLIWWFRAAWPALTALPRRGWPHALAAGCIASMIAITALGVAEDGPFIGRARGAEILLVWFIAAFPLAASRWTRPRRPARGH